MNRTASLLRSHEKLGSPVTFFTLKKNSGNIEKAIEEADVLFRDLLRLKESGKDVLLDDDGNILIERIIN